MGGKALLLIIAGFTLVFIVVSQNMGSYSTRAIENLVEYHNEIIAHNIAVSGANIAANQMYFNPDWNDGYSKLPFQDGTLDIEVEEIDPYQDLMEIRSRGKYNGYTAEVKVPTCTNQIFKICLLFC